MDPLFDEGAHEAGMDSSVIDEVRLISKGFCLGLNGHDQVLERVPCKKDKIADAYYSDGECRGRASGQPWATH